MSGRDDLTALLGSRICHDLVSPLGAIGNGVELLAMSGHDAVPELALIAESVGNATARIRFFRIAFGATGEDSRIGAAEMRSILADLTRGGRLRIDWNSDEDVPRGEAKLAFLLILCLESALPFGGRITASSGGGQWRLSGAADRVRADPALWGLLVGEAGGVAPTSGTVHFALVPDLARRLGRTVRTTLGETAVTISF
jgi:histidine phosphotransferase ChpT